MNERRLTILREFLRDEVPVDMYDQHSYSHGNVDEGILHSACALGWATQCPALQSEGLENYYKDGIDIWPSYMGNTSACGSAREFFSINMNQFMHIFGVSANIDSTNKFEAIRHIDEVLSGEIV